MRKGHSIETRHDRRALANDAGLRRISAISVLAGALAGMASLVALLTIAAAIGIGIHGGTDFSTTSDAGFKAVAAAMLDVSALASFFFAGYVAGRMGRRGGTASGLLAGFVGVLLAIAVGVVMKVTHGDIALGRMARRDIHVVITWSTWRFFSLIAGISTAAAMVLGGLFGGLKGERWHAKLLARAIDPTYGPEAAESEAARRRAADAETTRLDATRRVAQVTTTSHRARAEETAGAVPLAGERTAAVPGSGEPAGAVPLAGEPAGAVPLAGERTAAVPGSGETATVATPADEPATALPPDATIASPGGDVAKPRKQRGRRRLLQR